jgi:hypothetical protein
MIGLDKRGAIVFRAKLSRSQLMVRLASLPPCLIGMEACVGTHHLSRRLIALGHDARLMPAKYVKPFVKSNKNDFRDAEAIAEAVQRPTMRFVATKTAEQLDLQALRRVRSRLIGERTATVNEIRAFLLDRGIAVATGIQRLRKALPDILATHTDVLSPLMTRAIIGLATDWRRLDQRIEEVSSEITALASKDAGCGRLMTVPGIGPLDGGHDRRRRPVHEGSRLRRLARDRAQTALHWRPHDPQQDGRPRRPPQARELGALRSESVDRGRATTTASQQAGDRARQQARPHRLGGAPPRSQFRSEDSS